jgi:hypothetical protein
LLALAWLLRREESSATENAKWDLAGVLEQASCVVDDLLRLELDQPDRPPTRTHTEGHCIATLKRVHGWVSIGPDRLVRPRWLKRSGTPAAIAREAS